MYSIYRVSSQSFSASVIYPSNKSVCTHTHTCMQTSMKAKGVPSPSDSASDQRLGGGEAITRGSMRTPKTARRQTRALRVFGPTPTNGKEGPATPPYRQCCVNCCAMLCLYSAGVDRWPRGHAAVLLSTSRYPIREGCVRLAHGPIGSSV
jgi:hypothetical protein